jgi:hypothetical protein
MLLTAGRQTQKYFKFYYQLGQVIKMSDCIMCILTSPLQSSHGPLSLAFGEGVLKSLGTHIARSPHYHVLGPSLICLSPQVSLANEYLASCKHSIEYTSIQSL